MLLAAMATVPARASFLQVRPLRAVVECLPDEPFAFAIRLANQPDGTPVLAACLVADQRQMPDGGMTYPAAGSTANSCAEWLKLSAHEPRVGPGETFTLTVNGTVPKGASGSYHAAILITPMPPAASGSGLPRLGLGLTYAFPVDVLIGATGYTGLRIDDLALRPLPAQGAAVAGGRPVTMVVAELRNVGDRIGYLQGTFAVRRVADGAEVARCAVSREPGARVLPQSATAVSAALREPLPAGDYRIELQGYFDRPPRLMHAVRGVRWAGAEPSSPTNALVAEVESYRIKVEPARLSLPISEGSRTNRRLLVRNRESVALECVAVVTAFEVTPSGNYVVAPSVGARPEVVPAELRLPPQGVGALQLQFGGAGELAAEREHYWLVQVTGRPAGGGSDPQEVALGRALIVAAERTRLTPASLALEAVRVVAGPGETVLQLSVANQGGTSMPLAGQVSVRTADGRALGQYAVGDGEVIEVLAGMARTVEIRVAGELTPEGWQGDLAYQARQGVKRLPFEVRLPQAVEAGAGQAQP